MDRLANEVHALRAEIAELRDTMKLLNGTLMQLIGTPHDNVESKYTPASPMPSGLALVPQESLMEPQMQSSTYWHAPPPPPVALPTATPTSAAPMPQQSEQQPQITQSSTPPTPSLTLTSTDIVDSKYVTPPKRRKHSPVDSSKYNFPLRTQEDLQTMEEILTNTDCRVDVVNEMKALLGLGGMRKNIMNIISPPIMVDYNVDGKHGKHRLRNYTNVMNALHTATCDKDKLSCTDFLEEFRRALKLAKNKYFKSLCIARKRARQRTELSTKSEDRVNVEFSFN